MIDNQQVEPRTQRLLRVGTLTLTALSPVINTLAARMADRLERGGKRTEDFEVLDVEDVQDKPRKKKVVISDGNQEEVVIVKQPLSETLRERGEILVQELEDLIERGTTLSQSLLARSSDVTRDLADRGNFASQELLKRSQEIQKELGKRGKKLNKDLSKRSQKVAKELGRRSEKVAKELNKRSQQVTRKVAERNGTFWIFTGFIVGLSAAGIAAYILIKQRVRQQQQLEEEQSIPLSQDGYLNTTPSSSARSTTPTTSGPIIQQATPSPLVGEAAPAVAVAEQESNPTAQARQSAPSNAAFIGVVGTKRYYPVATPLDQLATAETGKNDVIYFTTEDEAKQQGYSSGL